MSSLSALVNVRLVDREGLWRLEFAAGRLAAIEPWEPGAAAVGERAPDEIDGEGGLALPPFIEPHIHLDSTLTAGEPEWNRSGTLFEGIARWRQRKASLTREDVLARARKTLSWQIAGGIQFVRTHVDVTDPELTALRALIELREEIKPWLTLQIVAFPQDGIHSYRGGPRLLEEALSLGADAVGAIPHYEHTREYGVQSVDTAFQLAERHDAMVDVHCDEIDDEQSRFVEVVAARAYEMEMGARVTASHTTAMHSYNGAYTFKLFSLIERSGISFIANPLVNIHLQGRFDDYPKRRGLTRVGEMLDRGINVCFGHDDVLDPWYPLGTGNMLQVLHMGLHACHLLGSEQIGGSWPLITANAARALCVQDDYGLETGKPANLIVLPARDWYEAVRLQPPVRYSIREGRVIAETKPASTTVDIWERMTIDYRR